ncbi:unnamed protein product [Ilex paraguariensis]|uniref:Uncharacterized protein n=1 Tax=Ilex paraguariensis TaxID=185542 RepID=A0ABC8RMD6_9AQUA
MICLRNKSVFAVECTSSHQCLILVGWSWTMLITDQSTFTLNPFLDGIVADRYGKLQRRMQNYIEILYMLKIRNSILDSNGAKTPLQQHQKISTGLVPWGKSRRRRGI